MNPRISVSRDTIGLCFIFWNRSLCYMDRYNAFSSTSITVCVLNTHKTQSIVGIKFSALLQITHFYSGQRIFQDNIALCRLDGGAVLVQLELVSGRFDHDLDAGACHGCFISIRCLLESKAIGDERFHVNSACGNHIQCILISIRGR